MTKRISRARAILQQYDALAQRRYDGSIDAIEELVDLASAVEKAGLNERQATAISLVFIAGHSQQSAADTMGLSQPRIAKLLRDGIAKIDAVYDRWEALENRSDAEKNLEVLIALKTMKEAA